MRALSLAASAVALAVLTGCTGQEAQDPYVSIEKILIQALTNLWHK